MYIPYGVNPKELQEVNALMAADITKFGSSVVKSLVACFRSFSFKARFRNVGVNA